jgi:urease accessory protein
VLRQTQRVRAEVTVYLVGGAAGPLAGDRLRLDIEVGEHASVCLRTVAASIALPSGAPAPSRIAIRATVASGGSLAFLPEQLVAATGCRHRTVTEVELDEGASLVWRDELVCGRYDERPGDASVSTSVTYAGSALLRQTLSIGPAADGWDGPAVLGAAKATGSLLRVRPDAESGPAKVIAPTAVRMPLSGPASLTTATAADAHTLRTYLEAD